MSGAAVAAGQQTTQKPPATTQQPPPPATTPPPQIPAAPPATAPAPQTPGVPPAAVGVPAIPPTPAGPPAARTFTAACGLWLHPVRPERVADFEKFLAYVREALAKTTNARLREQARGWRFLKAAEAGPNGWAMYVFLIDPAVPGAEYALGPILSEIYPDAAQLTEIWSLYTTSVMSGGTIMNFAPVPLMPPPPVLAAPIAPVPPAAPGQKPAAPVPAPAPAPKPAAAPAAPPPC